MTPTPTPAHDDPAWIAARQAASLAHRDLIAHVLAAPYDRLPPELAALRRRRDRATEHVLHLQSLRAVRGRTP